MNIQIYWLQGDGFSGPSEPVIIGKTNFRLPHVCFGTAESYSVQIQTFYIFAHFSEIMISCQIRREQGRSELWHDICFYLGFYQHQCGHQFIPLNSLETVPCGCIFFHMLFVMIQRLNHFWHQFVSEKECSDISGTKAFGVSGLPSNLYYCLINYLIVCLEMLGHLKVEMIHSSTQCTIPVVNLHSIQVHLFYA